jgi:hypothetical protein
VRSQCGDISYFTGDSCCLDYMRYCRHVPYHHRFPS